MSAAIGSFAGGLVRDTSAARSNASTSLSTLGALALFYVALPNAIFLAGFIVFPLGPISALLLLACVATVIFKTRLVASAIDGRGWVALAAISATWCLIGGQGHILYANSDWWVRDAVLLDLVRNSWPVVYRLDGVDTLLRAPLGFYLPAALVGKLFGIRAAELALFAWSAGGICVFFGLLVQDRPSLRTAAVRLLVFVFFSGMDILPTMARNYPHDAGAMIEWWAAFLSYESMTTLLFWVPNHTLPGWIATAWLMSQDPRKLSTPVAFLLTVLMPIWAPLTALGFAPIAGVAILRRLVAEGARPTIRSLDIRLIVITAGCVLLIFPYLLTGGDELRLAGNGQLNAFLFKDIPWVGDDYLPRIIEFELVEFLVPALLLIWLRPRDPIVWTAFAVLVALPFFRFGPYNDLVMRSSIPALAVLAIGLGRWLATPMQPARGPGMRLIAVLFLAVGAVTPISEMMRVVFVPRWDMNTQSSLIEVTQGAHYLTPLDQPWLRTFIASPSP